MRSAPRGRAWAALATLAFTLPFSAAAIAQTTAPKTPAAPKPPAKAAEAAPEAPKLTVAQIVAKHVAARGGVDAWKGVHGLQLAGKLEAGKGSMDAMATNTTMSGKRLPAKEGSIGANLPEGDGARQVLLPFVMDVKRPNKTRLEIEFAGKTAIQVYDGSKGWKLRPFLNRKDVEPFTSEEAKSQAAQAEPEGLLVNYAAKGSSLALDGVDRVDGQAAYKIKVKQKDGSVRHVWVDAKSFLDVKVDGTPRRMDGKMHDVYVMQRDFRTVNGVVMPFQLETAVDGYADTHKMTVEKAQVNPNLDDALFVKPKA